MNDNASVIDWAGSIGAPESTVSDKHGILGLIANLKKKTSTVLSNEEVVVYDMQNFTTYKKKKALFEDCCLTLPVFWSETVQRFITNILWLVTVVGIGLALYVYLQNHCTCQHGHSAKTCQGHNTNECDACIDGYWLEEEYRQCIPNQCECFHGQPYVSEFCTKHGAIQCQFCNPGYQLDATIKNGHLELQCIIWKKTDSVSKKCDKTGFLLIYESKKYFYPKHVYFDIYLVFDLRVDLKRGIQFFKNFISSKENKQSTAYP